MFGKDCVFCLATENGKFVSGYLRVHLTNCVVLTVLFLHLERTILLDDNERLHYSLVPLFARW